MQTHEHTYMYNVLYIRMNIYSTYIHIERNTHNFFCGVPLPVAIELHTSGIGVVCAIKTQSFTPSRRGMEVECGAPLKFLNLFHTV